jgi:hypothetical protein
MLTDLDVASRHVIHRVRSKIGRHGHVTHATHEVRSPHGHLGGDGRSERNTNYKNLSTGSCPVVRGQVLQDIRGVRVYDRLDERASLRSGTREIHGNSLNPR